MLAEALTEAAKELHRQDTVAATLDAIVNAALHSVPGFDHVGVSITHRNGQVETVAGTGRLVWDLDRLQYALGEGPCLDAIHHGCVILVEHARHEQRWPRYISEAVRAGLRAQLGICLYHEDKAVGGLNFYSTESETIDPECRDTAEMFAQHASIALGRTRREANLSEALLSRQMIGQAVGIVMERYQITSDRAFQFIVRGSQTGNVKVRDIAQELVDIANERFSPTP